MAETHLSEQTQKAYDCFIWMAERLKADYRGNQIRTSVGANEKIDFAGNLTCPLILSLREGLENVLKVHYAATGQRGNCCLPLGKSEYGWFEDLGKTEQLAAFPDVVVSETMDDLFSKYFLENFADRGYFQASHSAPIPKIFIEQGIPDPKGHFTVLAANPFVIVADHRLLKGLPVPQGWSELLSPVYKNKIIIGGTKESINVNILLNVYKDYGMEGVKKLAQNIKATWMHTHMGKRIGTGYKDGAGIYVLPWAIARLCARRDSVSIVWPKEGAWTQLMYLLAKKSRTSVAEALVRYVTGQDFAGLLAQNLFPPLYPEVKSQLPEGARLKWLGWEYIRANDLGEMKPFLAAIFSGEMRNKGQGI